MTHVYQSIYHEIGPVLLVLISVVGIRMLSYWRSFAFHLKRYRHTDPVPTDELRNLALPFLKIQITTLGSAGSTEVVLRGIRNVQELGSEDPELYGKVLSVELVTESQRQADYVEAVFETDPVSVTTLVLPADYETPKGNQVQGTGSPLRRRATPKWLEQEESGRPGYSITTKRA